MDFQANETLLLDKVLKVQFVRHAMTGTSIVKVGPDTRAVFTSSLSREEA